ncbi:MAG: FAD binding domain-containing protein [Nitriliruptoraceae bacterium]|nr:FAD binding domain-containing protein [Nitriliruptoraceae bacterium]
MPIARPTSLDDAVAVLADDPAADVLAGGTDAMVEISFDHRRPRHVLALRRIDELRQVTTTSLGVRIGAMVTYGQIERDHATLLPGLAMASRTVGSPQIRNAGTIGGNLGTASPAGDALPWLLAMDAEVELASVRGTRRLPVAAFVTGPKRTARADDELIVAVHVPAMEGPQHTAKLGPRNAMVISVACTAVVLDTAARQVRIGMGAVGPTPLRAPDAEAAAAEAIDWDALRADGTAIAAFGQACAAAASPIDDHRSTAEYRRHAVGVLASRSLTRCLAA